MASDKYYDSFDYNSSQDYADIEDQIDLFETYQYFKTKRQNKQKIKISSYSTTRKHLKSPHPLIKIHGTNGKQTSEFAPAIFRYTRYSPKKPKPPNQENRIRVFECDKQLPRNSTYSQSERPHDFDTFRHHFYGLNHEKIKASFQNRSNLEILNIRFAPIAQSVQKDFMDRFHEDPSFYPDLVYHGTTLTNIQSILNYGFLIPNQPHPTNSKAPIIPTQNGSAYGTGIYCSQTADYSLSYTRTTNTLLVCAALPKRDGAGVIQRSHGNILVLSHVSEIIPLFLIDIRYMDGYRLNQPCFKHYYPIKAIMKKVEEDPNKPIIISKKYLRKVLNCLKDQIQIGRRHRGRRNNQRKIQWEDEYQVRVFDIFSEKLPMSPFFIDD